MALATLLSSAKAEEVTIGVASNFAEPAREIAEAFRSETGNTPRLSLGSTGQLFAQISQGAPLDVYLAADQERPKRAIKEGYAVPGSQVTYAIGRLVLFSADPRLVSGPESLEAEAITRIAIANPLTAPYGAAAVETMNALGVYDRFRDRIVQGNNIAQTYQFVVTGNAMLGFVAFSQTMGDEHGSQWAVPAELHAPIAQDAVLLNTGAGNKAATSFMSYLQGPDARRIIEGFGYLLPD